MKLAALIILSSALAICQGKALGSSDLTESDIVGSYRMVRNGATSDLKIEKKPNQLIALHFDGGSDGALGDNVPADCQVDAEGAIYKNLLNAVILDEEEAQGKRAEKDHLKVAIRFQDKQTAKVTRADIDTLCGVGASFTGDYTRVSDLKVSSLLTALEKGKITLQGKIGKKARVKMDLEKNGAELKGSYVYIGKNEPLRLQGELTGNKFSLDEYQGSSKTGHFKGVVLGTELKGQWASPAGKKELPFTVSMP